MASTNQRIGFDVDPAGRYLVTGSLDHQALVYDLASGECVANLAGQADAVNDAAFHPYAGMIALGTGQRHFPLPQQRSVGGSCEAVSRHKRA